MANLVRVAELSTNLFGGDIILGKHLVAGFGQANEQIEASYSGADLTVAFNPEFLIAGVDSAVGETVTLETTDNLKPAVLRSLDRSDYLYLLMPVRV